MFFFLHIYRNGLRKHSFPHISPSLGATKTLSGNEILCTSCRRIIEETWLKYQTEEYKKAWPKPAYMNEPREMVYVRDGGDGSWKSPVLEFEGLRDSEKNLGVFAVAIAANGLKLLGTS